MIKKVTVWLIWLAGIIGTIAIANPSLDALPSRWWLACLFGCVLIALGDAIKEDTGK